jgi:hypothetical protein
MRPFLGKRTGIEHHDSLSITQRLNHVTTQFRPHRLILPFAAADKELNRFTRHPVFPGNRLGGLAFQSAEQPLDHDPCVVALFLAIEQRHIPLQEAPQPSTTSLHLRRRDLCVCQKQLRLRMLQQ